MDLEDLEAFLALCVEGSITGLARRLGVPKSTVSRRLSRLEARLGAVLVERRADGVVLTARGREVQTQGLRVMAEVDRLREPERGPPLLRIAASPELAGSAALIELLDTFRQSYPTTTLDLIATARRLDLASESVDLALRLHLSPLAGPATLMTRALAELTGHLYAAPSVLLGRTLPTHPADLGQLPLVTLVGGLLRTEWRLEHAEHGTYALPIHAVVRATDLPLARQLALHGQGVAMLPDFMVADDVAQGALVPVLHEWRSPRVRVSALWRADRMLVPALRALLDLLPAFGAQVARW